MDTIDYEQLIQQALTDQAIDWIHHRASHPPDLHKGDGNYTSRRWVFTSFKDDEPVFQSGTHVYLVYQRERSPTTDRLHWQGYVKFRASVKRGRVQSSLGIDNSWCNGARGTPEQCYLYCTKEASRVAPPVEHGIKEAPAGNQGERTDLVSYREAVLSGATDGELATEHLATYAKYPTLAKRLRYDLDCVPRRCLAEPPTVNILWGCTGSGKTHSAFAQAKELGPYYVLRQYGELSGVTCWNGYRGEEIVIIDEFYGWAKWNELLGWLDRYEAQVRVHGDTVQLMAHTFFITSNSDPRTWYSKLFEEGKAEWATLRRRISLIKHFSVQYSGVSTPIVS